MCLAGASAVAQPYSGPVLFALLDGWHSWPSLGDTHLQDTARGLHRPCPTPAVQDSKCNSFDPEPMGPQGSPPAVSMAFSGVDLTEGRRSSTDSK